MIFKLNNLFKKRVTLLIAILSVSVIFSSVSLNSAASKKPHKGTDANLYGHVVNEAGEHLPYMTVIIKGTTIGTRTDRTGHFNIIDLPLGVHTVVVRGVGYKTYEEEVEFKQNESIELKLTVSPAAIYSSEVVVTADRYATNRKEASVIVNTISPTTLQATQSTVLAEGLNYSPGLRMETNCQNCGFNQVRMNGMEGSYSQVLINSRPIFSGLAGVYGLELIPANMIDQIEIVRGGGSALYGSNAIAGTINLILKDPISNYFEAGASSALVGVGIDGSGDVGFDNVVSANTTIVSPNKKMGMALYGYYKERDPFDADGDDFSELSRLKNTTFGSRLFYRPSSKSKLAFDFFNINEDRRGGGTKFDVLPHEAEIAEALNHRITTGALTYTLYVNKSDEFNLYASAQNVARDAYYGAEMAPDAYGYTEGITYSIGSTYNTRFDLSTITAGIEVTGDQLDDTKLGYTQFDEKTGEITHIPNTNVTDQDKMTYSTFGQYELKWDRFKTTVGLRYDHYEIKDNSHSGDGNDDISGDVLSPRVTLLYDLLDDMQARLSYSSGYRAPQVFDEDLHIESSGLYKIIHKNSNDLKQETSHSFMGSIDYNTTIGNGYGGILIEGFYTILQDAFVNELQKEEGSDEMISYRYNAEDGAIVAGANIELNYNPIEKFSVTTGFTYQISEYEKPQEDFNEKSFYRTPDNYGFVTLSWNATEDLQLSASGNYTGSMLVPYFGLPDRGIPNYDPEVGVLIESPSFFDLGLKASYDLHVGANILQIYGGIKNAFNSYQDDFDKGMYRDPGYIYGPGAPRTVYLGFSIKG